MGCRFLCLQGISASIAENAKHELEKQVLPKAEVVARNQESKRHELKNRMQAIACQHEADIAEEVGVELLVSDAVRLLVNQATICVPVQCISFPFRSRKFSWLVSCTTAGRGVFPWCESRGLKDVLLAEGKPTADAERVSAEQLFRYPCVDPI